MDKVAGISEGSRVIIMCDGPHARKIVEVKKARNSNHEPTEMDDVNCILCEGDMVAILDVRLPYAVSHLHLIEHDFIELVHGEWVYVTYDPDDVTKATYHQVMIID